MKRLHDTTAKVRVLSAQLEVVHASPVLQEGAIGADKKSTGSSRLFSEPHTTTSSLSQGQDIPPSGGSVELQIDLGRIVFRIA